MKTLSLGLALLLLTGCGNTAVVDPLEDTAVVWAQGIVITQLGCKLLLVESSNPPGLERILLEGSAGAIPDSARVLLIGRRYTFGSCAGFLRGIHVMAPSKVYCTEDPECLHNE